ncbi:MAG: class I SAM-dependent methyltransferase [Promethearchaeota archaeon]
MSQNHKKRKKQSNIDFKIMSLFFKLRDVFNPPIRKIEKANVQESDIVLDYGCGPGSYSIAAAKRVGHSGIVYCADINPLAVEKVEKKALKLSLCNIETIQTDCKTNLNDNSIDIILCFDVLHAIEDQKSILKEFHRILKPKGIFSFDDHHYKESELESLITSNGLFSLVEKKEKQYNFSKN